MKTSVVNVVESCRDGCGGGRMSCGDGCGGGQAFCEEKCSGLACMNGPLSRAPAILPSFSILRVCNDIATKKQHVKYIVAITPVILVATLPNLAKQQDLDRSDHDR